MKATPTARVFTALCHAVLALGAIFMILPMLWMLSTSFKPPTEVSLWPPHLLPQAPTLANYTGIFEVAPFGRFFLNSAGLSLAATLSVVITSLVAGAVFAKYLFPGRTLLFMLILTTAIVPFESYMIPLYIQLIPIKWINTYQGILLPYLIMSFGVFLLRQHISSAIPSDLLEAARMDGASEWWILVRVIAPLSASALGALGIFAFIQAWAAFIWPLLIANNQLLFNMELGLTAFQFRFSTDYGKLMAGSVLSVLPMLVVFVILRRRIIESVALTGLKG
ncbi:MAG: carbohydrate ABC transporter permease [Bacillati bacterium ANGP1]|uniref:Carbohydrate ABC transporter permease n=1 Tax=Candidatus Segetimicrobium genomatis TaxID=2569760 RepID=A0A537J2Q9_9BACT|nr:MAG: carbohydrate ABC transporter permease [Terrabacteria group bacterium ANGP1]